jgi:hypothetical protein
MLAPILNAVQTLMARLTTTRAAYLDKLNITGNVADGNIYTDVRGIKLDNLDTTILSRAPSGTALSTAVWTNQLAGYLLLLKQRPQIKVETGGIVVSALPIGGNSQNDRYFVTQPIIGNSDYSANAVTSDRKFGYRKAETYDGSGNLVDVVNTSGSGWVLGCSLINYYYDVPTVRLVFSVDGITLFDSGSTQIAVTYGFIPVGKPLWVSAWNKFVPMLNFDCPVRFNSNLRVQMQSNNANVYSQAVYLLE